MYTIPIVLGAVSLLFIALSLTILVKSAHVAEPIRFTSDESEASVAGVLSQVTVDIEGAVVHPGVYHLPQGSRVEDAITAAGGLAPEANIEALAASLNRAAKVVDGGKIYIPILSSSSSLSPQSPASPLVSVNFASQSDLESLAGVGPVTAQKIIAGRPYQTLFELVTKKAMSQSLFDKLKDELTL